MTGEIPTPLANKHADNCEICGESVHASFARKLERELIQAKAEIAALKAGLRKTVQENQFA